MIQAKTIANIIHRTKLLIMITAMNVSFILLLGFAKNNFTKAGMYVIFLFMIMLETDFVKRLW